MKRILGIDPGLLHTGWAIIDVAGSTRKYIASGVILPPTRLPLPERLAFIFNGVSELCETFQPNECSIEVIFVEANKIKKALTGVGHADKDQIYKMLSILLPMAHPKTADESDAIAIALTHANTSRFDN